MMSQPRTLRSRLAFTLIELLVVITILAVLAALILPKLMSRADDAKVAKATTDLADISKYLETYRLDTGRYPTTDEGLDALYTQPADATGWKGPYITQPVPDDPWQHPYVYQWPGANGEDSFSLQCLGADGQPGGDGINADIVQSE